jgi:ribulose 1,5-bisphosphate carboxylase large subunit-like protein
VDFVDLQYKLKRTDVVCTFFVEPAGVSMDEAAGV